MTGLRGRLLDVLLGPAERRLGVRLDYAREIGATRLGLLRRYGRIFPFLDPNRHVPADAYAAARLRAALATDCGTCVAAEIALARRAGLSGTTIDAILTGTGPTPELDAVVRLTDAVVLRREDDADARADIVAAYGKAGLIELSFAMNGAALLPGIKRAMGFATACDLSTMRRLSDAGS
ncbi:hypothetical protein [Jannaschia sp. LMIT008]|uniref:hypothetical protein n=1 Tax=Jannaschia maritima TaxID=3032585 RepID=UPI0028121BC2|nr:hypothetical protein [Jannaschia sp. LMIT008]